MEWLFSLIVLSVAYLIGSIPLAYLLSVFVLNTDVRTTGSRDFGALNVYRVTKKRWALYLISVLKYSKGLLAVYLTIKFFPGDFYLLLSASGGVLLGEVFPVWLGFKGANGLNVAAGALTLIDPTVVALWLILFLIFFLPLRQHVIASLVATFSLPLIIFFTRHIYFTDNTLLLILPISMLIFQRFLGRVPDLVEQKSLKIKNGEG